MLRPLSFFFCQGSQEIFFKPVLLSGLISFLHPVPCHSERGVKLLNSGNGSGHSLTWNGQRLKTFLQIS